MSNNRRSALTASLAMSFSELQFVEALRKEPASRNVQVRKEGAFESPAILQGSAERWSPGFVIVVCKGRQKW